MSRSAFIAALLPIVASVALSGVTAPAAASDRERNFFRSVEGRWSGPGEIVAGKYKGTKFVCNFTGATPTAGLGMSLDGGCRVGLFTQRMSASIERKGGSGYRGIFMDGAQGKGLDVVAGRVDRDRVVFSLHRNALNGTMQARIADEDTMNVTVSVRVEDEMVPVIGMSLRRQEGVGSLARH